MIRLVVTCGRLKIGGVQASLVSLLRSLDLSTVDITLIVDEIGGELFDQIPAEVKVLKLEGAVRDIHELGQVPGAWMRLLRSHPLAVAIGVTRVLTRVMSVFRRKLLMQEIWRLYARRTSVLPGMVADVAISYAGGMGVWDYYVIDCISAPRKIVWLHGDYSRFGTRSDMEREYIRSFDAIVAVSEHSAGIIRRELAEVTDRVHVIPNLIDSVRIHALAREGGVVRGDSSSPFTFVSVARLDKAKGLDMAIRAAERLVRDGLEFRWLILGDGSDRRRLEKLIRASHLGDRVVLLGSVANPYPLMARADAILHPSRGEGRSIAIDEAKVLCRPIVVTAYPTVRDQIEDGLSGLVVPVSDEGLYQGMKTIMSDPELRDRLQDHLRESHEPRPTVEMFMELIR